MADNVNLLFELIDEFESQYEQDKLNSFTSIFDCFNLYNEIISKLNKKTIINFYDNQFEYKEFLNDCNKLIKYLTLSLKYYSEGKIFDSYKSFIQIFSRTNYFNLFMIGWCSLKQGEYLYRLREHKDKSSKVFSIEQIFHVPFQLRNNISTKRFSIPGFPSLYLGSSTYLCWEELDRPPINNLSASRYALNQDIHLLDLTKIDRNNAKSHEIVHYFLKYPLILACSMKVNDYNNVFKPQYIIPQFLLEYVRNSSNYAGIKYDSTHLDQTCINSYEHYNVVLPVTESKENGYCDVLKSYFNISIPINFQILDITTLDFPGFDSTYIAKINHRYKKFNLLGMSDGSNSLSKNYGRSKFGKMEMKFMQRDGE